MKSKDVEITPNNQVDAITQFQNEFELDITFPIMDLDEYVGIVSNAKEKRPKSRRVGDGLNLVKKRYLNQLRLIILLNLRPIES